MASLCFYAVNAKYACFTPVSLVRQKTREKKKEDPITHTRAQKDTRCLRIVVGVIILRSYPSAGSKGHVRGDVRHFPARGESLIGA